MKDVLSTILGTKIPITTRGIVYLCVLSDELKVVNEILCNSAFEALEYYANIPNPESQLVTGKTFDELMSRLILLHKNIKDPKWIKELRDCI